MNLTQRIEEIIKDKEQVFSNEMLVKVAMPQIEELIDDVAIEYEKWKRVKGKRALARHFKTLYPVTDKQAFNFYKQNIYGK